MFFSRILNISHLVHLVPANDINEKSVVDLIHLHVCNLARVCGLLLLFLQQYPLQKHLPNEHMAYTLRLLLTLEREKDVSINLINLILYQDIFNILMIL